MDAITRGYERRNGTEYARIDSADLTPRAAFEMASLVGSWRQLSPAELARASRWSKCVAPLSDEVVQILLRQLAPDAIERVEITIWKPEIWQLATAGAEEAFGEERCTEQWWPRQTRLWFIGDRCATVQPADVAATLEVPGEFSLCFLALVPIAWPRVDPCPRLPFGGTSVHGLVPVVVGASITESGSDELPVGAPVIRVHEPILVGDTEAYLYSSYTSTIAASKFLETKFARLEDTPLPRAERRRRDRAGARPTPVIRRVLLRRPERAHEAAHNSEQGKVDWSCQWFVGSFWRRQWYPSLGVHKPTFIDSYVKGPKDKPLKPPSKSIFIAAR